MRGFTLVLTLAVVLVPAGTTFAGIQRIVGTYLGNGLTSYQVTSTGYSSFKDLRVIGDVHQVWTSWLGEPATPTLYSDTITSLGWPNNAAATAADTFFILTKNGGESLPAPLTPAGALTETNTLAGSPMAPPVVGAPGFADYVPGMGSIGDVGTIFGFGSGDYDPETDVLDLMQVVIPSGSAVWLTGLGLHGETETEIGVPIWEPEPSTLLMLITGSLCLLGFRYRK